ncbi:ATP-dependent DNA helicase Pif1-like [Rhizophagus clarus]|uniref:ATP-dependent DNA helicase Pif1-like n=1 Tax=Rhizophagus clarus TaxID=94130 RepID=A0A8H3L2U1_9GLOM|nr:ATP-dependent DNA helicase Pif1-like [Rhizophagus clarus]
MDDWRTLATCFDDSSTTENNQFVDAIHITSRKVDVYEINITSKADSDTAKGLEAQLLLSKGARVMLRANLSVKTGLVNGSIGMVDDILFQENQGPPSLLIAVLVDFDNYTGPAIISTKADIDLDNKKYATGLSFVAVSYISALKNILFKPFSFERLQRIRTCKRLQERKEEEKRLDSMMFHN